MAANDSTTFNNSNLAVGGIGAMSLAALSLAVFGTVFHSGNDVSSQTTTARLLNGTQGYDVVTAGTSTATGGLASGNGGGNYKAIEVVSPMSAVNAPLNGVNVGSGVVAYVQIDPIAPESASTITCSIASAAVRGTGGTALISRHFIQTGSILTFAAGSGGQAPTIGPTQSIRCSVNPSPGTAFNVPILVKIVPSQVKGH